MRLIDPTNRRRSISLTPLIDVVFILLLFFMLSTQFSRQQSMNLTVTADGAHSTLPDPAMLKLQLSADGSIVIDGGATTTMSKLLQQDVVRIAIVESKPIYLGADDEVSLQQLLTASELLGMAGARDIRLSALR